MALQRLAQPAPAGGQVAGETGVVLREAGARPERLLPDRARQALGELDQGLPGGRVVGAGADHERGRLGLREQVGQLRDGGRLGRAGVDQPRRRGQLVRLARRGEPVVHRHDHERRPAARARLVPGPRQGARHVLRPHRLAHPDRVVAGQAAQPPREERLLGEVAAVLLADQHDERRAIDARGDQGVHGVAEAGGGVHEHEGRLAAGDRVSTRHADQRTLVQGEHELEVVGQATEERHLGRARIAEDLGEPASPQDVEDRFPDGGHGRHGTGHMI